MDFIHKSGKVFPHVFPFLLRKNERRKNQSLQGIFGFSHVSTGTTSITATIFKLFCSLKGAEKEKASVFRGKVENTDVFALRASDFVLYIYVLFRSF